MGEVYRARDTRLERDVALKVLQLAPDGSGPDASTGGAARMLREARSAAALEHPNVVAVYDVGTIEEEPPELRGSPYIAMELIRGKSLRAFIGNAGVPMADRVRWLAEAARALGAAHKAGLVHRDVKPENVMVRDDGAVKVLDFGIAKRWQQEAIDPTSSTEAQVLRSVTSKGVVVGTPYYMAPEQMRLEPLDGRADQFSWGVMAYELLAGKPPWKLQGDALQLVSEILSADPRPLQEVNAEVPGEAAQVVMRALAKTREKRFATME
jgi:serine/threonine-protein kinase